MMFPIDITIIATVFATSSGFIVAHAFKRKADRLERDIKQLEWQVHDLRKATAAIARDVDRTPNPFAVSPARYPVVIAHVDRPTPIDVPVGPPCDPPDGRGPFR